MSELDPQKLGNSVQGATESGKSLVEMYLTASFCIRAFISIICALILYKILFAKFVGREKSENVSRPSSFFRLDEINTSKRLSSFAFIFCAPPAALLFFYSMFADNVVKVCRDFVVSDVVPSVGASFRPAVQAIADGVPAQAGGVFLLAFFILLIKAPGSSTLVATFRDYLVDIFELDTDVDGIAAEAADTAIRDLGEAGVVQTLSSRFKITYQVPERLQDAPLNARVANLLLFLGKKHVAKDGLIVSLRSTLAGANVSWRSQKTQKQMLPRNYLIAGCIAYVVIGMAYSLLAPELDKPVHYLFKSIGAEQFSVEWPDDWKDVAIWFAQYTFSIIAPFTLGYQIYYLRTQNVREEHEYRRLMVAFAWEAILSVSVTILFYTIYISRNIAGKTAGELNFGSAKLWMDVVTSIASAHILLIFYLYYAKRFKLDIRCFLAFFVSCGIAFLISTILIEISARVWRGTFWQQALLGVFIAAAYSISFLKLEVLPSVASIRPVASSSSDADRASSPAN